MIDVRRLLDEHLRMHPQCAALARTDALFRQGIVGVEQSLTAVARSADRRGMTPFLAEQLVRDSLSDLISDQKLLAERAAASAVTAFRITPEFAEQFIARP